jgi:hypothetical protein
MKHIRLSWHNQQLIRESGRLRERRDLIRIHNLMSELKNHVFKMQSCLRRDRSQTFSKCLMTTVSSMFLDWNGFNECTFFEVQEVSWWHWFAVLWCASQESHGQSITTTIEQNERKWREWGRQFEVFSPKEMFVPRRDLKLWEIMQQQLIQQPTKDTTTCFSFGADDTSSK